MRLGIGIFGVCVLGASVMYACSGVEQPTDAAGSDLATIVAALSINGDGTDTTGTESVDPEPLMTRGCGFERIVETVIARFDTDQNGDLDATEKSALVAEHGDAEAGVEAEHPNQGQPGKAALLLSTYDVDDSGSLEAAEIAALEADIVTRCEERLSKLVEEFDTNGDGTLDDSEWEATRAALRERIREHRRDRFAKLDTNGDGRLEAEERAAFRQQIRERRAGVESQFDANDDGELNDEERDSVRDHRRMCVQQDLPMDSPEVAAAHLEARVDGEGRGDRPEIGSEGQSSEDTATETDEAASDEGAAAETESP